MKTPEQENIAPPPPPRTDVDALSRYVALPFTPGRAIYVAAPRGVVGFGPTDWELTALLTFAPRETAEIVADAARFPRARATVIVPPTQLDWFPPEARDLLVESPAKGGHVLPGEVYDARAFQRRPLTHGHFVRVGTTPHLYLYLYSM